MIREPIYDSAEDARLGKISKTVKSRVGKTPKPAIHYSTVKLNKADLKKAEADARATLERLVRTLAIES